MYRNLLILLVETLNLNNLLNERIAIELDVF